MSYDDGRVQDRRLAEIFDKNKIRGTFHLNSGKLGCEGYITKEELGDLFKNHEVSVHTVNHPPLTNVQHSTVINEIISDKKNLEEIMGYPVRGMSLPYGVTNAEVDKIISFSGMKYSRTTASAAAFSFPENFLRWNPTCHHKNALPVLDKFLETKKNGWRSLLFYVWGHSYEFDNDSNWDLIEEFCKRASGHDDVWYATNIEIYDYMAAVKNLIISVDEKTIINPSYNPVFVSVDGETLEIKGGQRINL